jgi:hypothetical protein
VAENCWVLATPDGIHLDNGDFVEHYTTAADAAKRAAADLGEYSPGHFADGTPLQLDQPCVIVRCGCCGERFDDPDEGHTVHFDTVVDSGVIESAGWTERADGTHRCLDCGPGPDGGDCENCRHEREAVASRG